ncbi:MAG: HPr family phosphocarrier protein, partial [Candidatus Cloacimonadota bacterium]
GKIQKENITKVIFEGDSRALNDIEILASINYGEDTMGKGIPLPKELGYLK